MVSNFTAQNIGAGREERVKQGFKSGVCMMLCVVLPFFFIYFFFDTPALSLFMKDSGSVAVKVGTDFLRIVSPFYFVVSVKLLADGVLRGAGAMKQFMVTTFSDLLLRVVLAFAFAGIWGWKLSKAGKDSLVKADGNKI